MLLQVNDSPVHEHSSLIKSGHHRDHSHSNPMQVTILASSWDWSVQSLFRRQLAKELAKYPQVKVTVLVPEGSCSEHDHRMAKLWGCTIVEAKKQPVFPDPKDWLIFPPEDLTTNIVVGVGEDLGQIAGIWKKHDQCKWLYVANPWSRSINNSKGRMEINIALCQEADLSAAAGPKVTDKLSASLRFHRKREFNLTPGIISEFCDRSDDPHMLRERPAYAEKKFRVLIVGGDDPDKFEDEGLDIAAKAVAELKDKFYRLVYVGASNGTSDDPHMLRERPAYAEKKFRVLIVGGDDPDKFEDEGLDIAAKAVAELNDKSYRLVYVGASNGTREKFAQKFHDFGIAKSQLTIRNLPNRKEMWTNLFCEVDLAIMPSGEKEFGMEALLASSAGLPVLVHGDSGFGEALSVVEFGDSAIVDSEDARVWAEKIKRVKETERRQRLDQAAVLRSNYDKKYSWEKQCEVLVGKMLDMVSGKKFIIC